MGICDKPVVEAAICRVGCAGASVAAMADAIEALILAAREIGATVEVTEYYDALDLTRRPRLPQRSTVEVRIGSTYVLDKLVERRYDVESGVAVALSRRVGSVDWCSTDTTREGRRVRREVF